MNRFLGRRTGRKVAFVGLLSAVVSGLAGTAAAHEEYVVGDEQSVEAGEFLAEALTDPSVIGPLLAGALAVLAVAAAYLRLEPLRRDLAAFRFAMREYARFVPWLLRISFGIPLIGAGFAGYYISPSVTVDVRILQIALGFLLLFGLATRVVALVTLAAYLVGAAVWTDLLLQLEYVGGMLAIALVGGGKPSADHVFGRIANTPDTLYGQIDVVNEPARRLRQRVERYEPLLPLVTRVSMGATFIYLGVSQKLLRPGIGLAVVERYDLTAVVPVDPALWVLGAGVTEATLGLALILGVFTRAGSAVAISMFSLTLFALPDDPVLAHVSLFGMASVLLITGGGWYSVDNWLQSRREAEDVEEEDVEEAAPTTTA
jgi:uncharacterized membrane protein YphA (DoxX/SURF4 family)